MCGIWPSSMGCPSRAGKGVVWDDLRRIARSESLPWVCMGDFNQILDGQDKLGRN